MVRTLLTKKMILAALGAGLLAGCGTTPYASYDKYGNPIDPYATNAYGSSTSSSYGSSSSAYGSSYDTSASSYGSSYGSSSSSSYGSTASSYDPYGTGTSSTTAVATPAPAPIIVATEASVLNAYVKDVKKNGLLGLGGLTARVEVSNPTNRTLGGKLRVTFTSGGHESGNMQARKITLRPLETQVLTFTASGMSINGAEATIDTAVVTSSQSTVSDLPH